MRMAMLAAAGMALAGAMAAGPARADGGAVELGLRSGYSIPFGDIAGGNPSHALSDGVSGMVPIWIDAGYKLNPNMYIGANFQYGIAFVNTDKFGECKMSGISCSANDVMFGVDFHYHLMPDQTIDPWAGIGIGYEILSVNESIMGQSFGGNDNGFQFVNLQLGADYKAMPNLGIGPFLMFSLGQFSSCSASGPNVSGDCKIDNQAMHEWLTIGLRGAYDIGL